MKKLLSLVAAAGMVLGTAAVASANTTDIKVKGQFDFGFGLYDGTNFTKHDHEQAFDAVQRFRAQVDFIASESLKGVAYFEIGNINWGSGGGATWGGSRTGNGAGGAMGADGVNVELKNLYIDWLVPQTDLQVRMGIQPFALPRAVGRADGNDGQAIMDDDVAGILLSYNINENFGVNAGWFRPWDGSASTTDPYYGGNYYGRGTQHYDTNAGLDDKVDMFTLTLPIQVKDAFTLTPWGMIAVVGEEATEYSGVLGSGPLSVSSNGFLQSHLSANGNLGDNGMAWWAGFAFDFTYLDPFVAAVDFMYGSYTSDHTGWGNYGEQKFTRDGNEKSSPDREGWAVVAKFGYKLDYFTPNVFGWYGSGTNNFEKDGMDGIMPTMSPNWGLTSFGYSQNHFGGREFLLGDNPGGTWAVGIGLDDIKFIEGLTSQFRVAYITGTNEIPYGDGHTSAYTFWDYGLLDASDHAIEVNLDNVYKIYENLDLFVELGYINVNLNHEPHGFQENAWKGYVGFTYSF